MNYFIDLHRNRLVVDSGCSRTFAVPIWTSYWKWGAVFGWAIGWTRHQGARVRRYLNYLADDHLVLPSALRKQRHFFQLAMWAQTSLAPTNSMIFASWGMDKDGDLKTRESTGRSLAADLGMGQYLLIPFLGGWTSIYQLFWCSPGVQGFDTLPFQSCFCISIFHGSRNGLMIPGASPRSLLIDVGSLHSLDWLSRENLHRKAWLSP